MSHSTEIVTSTSFVTKEKGHAIRIEGVVVGIVVLIVDTVNGVTGILYALLPEARGALDSPYRFVDAGLDDLFMKLETAGYSKSNVIVKIIGGSGFAADLLNIGKRNIERAKEILSQTGFFVRGVDIGGRVRRDVDIVSGESKMIVSRLNNTTLEKEIVIV